MSYTAADIEKVLALIGAKDLETLKAEDFDQFQYQGFDPMKLAAALLKVKDDKRVSDSDFKNDVVQMVAIGMIKGSVTDRNLNKMSEQGKASVNALGTKYGIKMGGGKNQNSSVITYPRVMATFPDACVRLTKVLGGKDFSGGPLLSTRLPYYMKVQVFCSVIPRDLGENARRMLLTACLCYSIDQSVQISEMKDPDLKQLASVQSNFTMIGFNSPVPGTQARLNVFKELSLSRDYDAIASVLLTYKEKIDPSFVIPEKSAFITEVVS